MRAQLLAADSPQWEAVLAGSRYDFHHLPAYVSLSAEQSGGEAAALLVRDDARFMLLPLVISPIGASGERDAASPYGYPGPVTNVEDDGFLTDAMNEGCAHLAAQGIVSLFVRFHPLLDPGPPKGVGTLVRHGDTVAVDLSRTEEELWRDTRRDHRSRIRKAEAAGLRVFIDPDPARFKDFARIYRQTMRRVSADTWYRFDDRYFADLRAALGDRLHLVTAEMKGAVAAAALFVETCGIVQYHLSGTDERFLDVAPTKLLLHRVRSWAKARGDAWLHLGGGLGAADDQLFLFKAGYSPSRFPFHTLRVVLRREAYRRLSGTERADTSAGLGFFPRYRRH